MQNSNNNSHDINECTSRGVCSLSPNIAALQELMFLFIKHAAFYIAKLEKSGRYNFSVNKEIIECIASLGYVTEISENYLYDIVLKMYSILTLSKNEYFLFCKNNNIKKEELLLDFEFSYQTPVSKAIAFGERIFLDNYNKISLTKRSMIDIFYTVLKNICINVCNISDFKTYSHRAESHIIKSINDLNKPDLSEKDIKSAFEYLSFLDYELQLDMHDCLIKSFGNISEVEVSCSSRKGKAILVSGSNLFDLLNVLEETKHKNIDVYTHSALLIAHSFERFKQYPNLVGHYGDTTDTSILDYATFPGAILLTKNSRTNTEYLYRGRLFSKDYISHKGVINIDDNNYSQLVSTAIASKGFSRGKIKPSKTIGYDEEKIVQIFSEIKEKLLSGKIKRVYIVGIDPYSDEQKEYYDEFFNLLNNDEFAISFSRTNSKKNVLNLNIGNYIPLAADIVHKFFTDYEINSKIIFFFTICNITTISHIITLLNKGLMNIFMSKCSPRVINPSVFREFIDIYGIKITTNPSSDLYIARKNKNTPQS